MVRADVIGLVTETRSAHGVHEAVTETVRDVLAEIRSVNRAEYYNALNAGIQPELVFKLTAAEDYQDEHFLRHNGKKYRIVRTYLTNDGGIEITAERSDENADAAADSNS
jgi:SPP1 family predicted phage head-tail adaptor